MKENWNGIMKIVEAKIIRNNEVIWENKNLYNILHSDGESMILQTLFYNDGSMPPEYYYLGLDSRVELAYADTMEDIMDEPSGSGYTRQQISSSSMVNSGWNISMGTSLHKAVTNIVSFNATGSYGPVSNLFLTDASDNSGNLISSVSLSSPATLNSGDTLSLRMTLSLRDCP
jgi:hypothetical protein